MKIEILNKVHPLMAEAWTKGFRPSILEDKIILTDLLGASPESADLRKAEAEELRSRIDQNQEEVLIYLDQLESLQVKIDSKVLGDTVWIVGSEHALKRLPENQVGYLPEEIYRIKQAGWTEEHLRKVHQAKKFFGGTIMK
ncbi:MAG: hypothetical protein HY282_07410 [Nitrospirae bacterium]|nr:hypothetical protein [Candidatus Manganitrophaceae bacterium]